MSPQKKYDIIRIPSKDWNNIAETVSLDGSYSEEIKNEIWTALEHIEFLLEIWIVLQMANGAVVKADILRDKESAEIYAERQRARLPKSTQVVSIKAGYRRVSRLDRKKRHLMQENAVLKKKASR
jgi:hypothetical protein